MSAPVMHTSTWLCSGENCWQQIRLTVHADKALSGGRVAGTTMDRIRLLAAANQWVIDFNRKAWCPAHKPYADGPPASLRARKR